MTDENANGKTVTAVCHLLKVVEKDLKYDLNFAHRNNNTTKNRYFCIKFSGILFYSKRFQREIILEIIIIIINVVVIMENNSKITNSCDCFSKNR